MAMIDMLSPTPSIVSRNGTQQVCMYLCEHPHESSPRLFVNIDVIIFGATSLVGLVTKCPEENAARAAAGCGCDGVTNLV